MTSTILDPQFPQIPLILETQRMRSILQLLLFRPTDLKKPKFIVEKCIIGEKRHKPGNSFVLSYHLDMVNVETGTRFEQVLTGKLYRPGEDREEYKRLQDKPMSCSSGIPAISHLPGLGMMIWAFPHDRKLEHLHHFLNLDYLKTYFAERSLAFGFTGSEQITSTQVEILHYLPERSCMIRYRITLTNRKILVFYGKHYRDQSGGEVCSTMRQLAQQIPASARPLLYDPEKKILWQSHVQGKPFIWERQTIVKDPELIKQIAACVFRFHRCTLKISRHYGLGDIEQQLLATQKAVTELNTGLSGRIQLLVNHLLNQRNRLDWTSDRQTPIHLDLKINNFLIAANNAELIDLDCVSLGDHLIDVASLIANFYLNGLRAGNSVAEIDAIVETLTHAYLALVPWPIDQARLNWYIAAALIHEVLRRSIRQCDEQRLLHIESYLDISERFLAFGKGES